MLYDRFWGVARDIVSLNDYAGIVKRKYITKATSNNHFHHSDYFFRTIIKALVITLCMHVVGCSTIESFTPGFKDQTVVPLLKTSNKVT